MDFNKYSEIGKDNGFSDEQIQKGWSLYSSKQIDPASVENNFSDLSSAEAALSFTENPKEESMIGKIAGYFSSSVKGDFDQIYNNVKEFSQEFTGNPNSTIESTYNDIQYEVLNFNQEDSTDNILDAIIDDQLGDQAGAYKDVVTELKDIQVPELETEIVEEVKEPTQRKKYTPRIKEPSYDERVSELTGAYGEDDELLYQELKSELPFTVNLQSNREDIIRGLQESERFLQLSEDEQISAYQAELVRDNPLAQFTTGAYETLLPEFIRKEIPFDVPDVESTPDLFFRMSGNISGFIGSLVGAGRIVKGLGGVRAIPQVGTYLNLVGKNNPKAAMYLEDALTSFAAFTLRNQTYIDPTTNITERAKLMKEDALYSIAFPVANIASQLRGGLAVGGGTMFAVGFHGEGTTTEKVVNGSALTLMYLIGQGVQYKQAKVQLKEFLKTSGIERNVIKPAGKTADELINSLNRPSIMKASADLRAMMYQQQSINRAAGEAQAKAAKGETLTLTDKIEVAAANQSSSVGLTKVGALPPIKGNRATKQLEQTVKLARQEAIKTEPTPVVEPAPAEDLAVKQTNLYTPSASELKAQEANILSNYSNPQTVAYELSKAPTLPADILMNESQQLIPYLDQASRFVEPREIMLPIKAQMRQMGDAERTFGLFVNFFRKFGTAYVSDKKLSDKLETSFSEIASAPLRGVREVAEAFSKFPKTSRQDRMDVTFAYESAAKDSLEPRLQPIYDLVQSAMTQMENSLITAGVLKKSFAELRDERINDLMKELDIAKKLSFREMKLEKELLDEIKFLKTVRNYLSHSVVLQRVVETKSKTLSIKERKNFTNKLTDLYQKRKGKLTLKEHFDSGLLSEADVDIVKLTMGTYADGFQKLAIRSLVDWGKDLGYIVPKNAKLIDPKNYVLGTDTSYGNRISDLQNKKIHVLFDDGFKEILGYNRKPANWYTRLLGAVKIGQFFNPAIIYKYNALQAFYGGSWTVNPKTVAKAFTAVNTKNELFLELDKYGLYQKQDLPIKRDIDREIAITSRQTLDRVGDSFKSRVGDILLDQAGFNKNDITKMLSDKKFMDAITTVISSPSSVVGNLTWYGDEVQRTMSAITLINKGYSPKEAAQTAARIHGAYSLVGTKYKQTMRNIAFVYSFRMLMPWKYNIQPTTTIINEAYKKATGKQGDKRKTKAAAWTLGVTMGIPLVVDMTLRANGWTDAMEEEKSGFRKTLEPTVINIGEDGKYGKFRGFFPQWKYTKPVTMPDGTEKEIVLALGNILNMVSKGAVRATAPIPESSNIPVDQAWNYLQWEINPTYKLISNYINNEPSFEELPPRGIDGTDWLGGMAWTIRKSFVVYDKTKWAEYLGLAEKQTADQVLDETFTTLEKIYNFFGNSYIRSSGEKRFKSMQYKFLENIKQSATNIKFAGIPEEEKEEAKKELFQRIEQFEKDIKELKE